MTLDQIIADALEQLPESHVRTLAEEVVRLRKIEAAARAFVAVYSEQTGDALKRWNDLQEAVAK